MIPTPLRFENNLTPADFQKMGQLMLRWSHIDHVIGNCLKVLLRLTDDEAIFVVFQLSTGTRLTRIRELRALKPFSPDADRAFQELDWVMKGIQVVRNNVIHAVVRDDGRDDQVFELRSKGREFTKAEIFSTEELTNYAAHAALVFRYALGEKDPAGAPPPLPDRPQIPACLLSYLQAPKGK